MAGKKRIIIVGGGFAGLAACDRLYRSRALIKDQYDVILIDRKANFDFLPLAPDVLGGWLDPAAATVNLREFAKKRDFEFWQIPIEGLDPGKNVIWSKTGTFRYDYALIAAGADVNFFDRKDLELGCLTLNSVQDALKIKKAVLDLLKTNKCANVVVVGAGYTGLEIALNLHYFLNSSRVKNCRIIVVEKQNEVLPGLPKRLRVHASRELKRRGIETITNETVAKYENNSVVLGFGKKIDSALCVWSAGVRAPGFVTSMNAKMVKERILVDGNLRIKDKGLENIFFAGDCCAFIDKASGKPIRMAVIFSIGQGKLAAANILNHISGKILMAYKAQDLGYLVPLTYRKAPGIVMGFNIGPGTGYFLHYLMNIYRSDPACRLLIIRDLVLERLFKRKTKGGDHGAEN